MYEKKCYSNNVSYFFNYSKINIDKYKLWPCFLCVKQIRYLININTSKGSSDIFVGNGSCENTLQDFSNNPFL